VGRGARQTEVCVESLVESLGLSWPMLAHRLGDAHQSA
jgi:hypothetical protein